MGSLKRANNNWIPKVYDFHSKCFPFSLISIVPSSLLNSYHLNSLVFRLPFIERHENCTSGHCKIYPKYFFLVLFIINITEII